MNLDSEAINKIYDSLGDELSRDIFEYRFMYYITNDNRYLLKTALTCKETLNVYETIKAFHGKKVIFGAGAWGKSIARTFFDIEFDCFVDNSTEKQKTGFAGKKVISFNEYIEKYKDGLVLISSRVYNKEIEQQLIGGGVKNIANIGGINDDLSMRSYFDFPLLCKKKREVFVDAGSLDGRTSLLFKKWCGESFGKTYAFEPDAKNIVKCRNAFANAGLAESQYAVIGKGLYDELGTVSFESAGNGASSINESGNETINVDRLDNMVNDDITFIKMDIEGAEYKALLGSEKTIKKNKPKLAICVYHKPEDIIKLPSLILQYVPDYKFFIRHYSTTQDDTVLYALPPY